MSRLGINTGNNPNDGQGDPLRVAMGKINSNFLEIYNTIGDGFDLVSYASTAGISSLAQNLTGTPRINVGGILNTGITTTEHLEVRNITSTGVVTATQFIGDGSQLTNVTALVGGLEVLDDNVRMGVARELNFGTNIISTGPDGVGRVTISVPSIVSSALYADTSGISSYSDIAGIATISTAAGFAETSNTSNYSYSSGISSYSNIAGIATESLISAYASIAGISTVAFGITGTPNIIVGVVTADSYNGSGSRLTGIITSLVAGTNISILQYAGIATINASGGVSEYSSSAGIATYARIAGYSTSSGISTVAQGLTGTPNINVNQVGISSYLTVTGVTSFYNNIHLEYERYLLIGNDNELQLFHNGSNSYIDNSSTNNLIIRTHSGSIILEKEGPENMGVFNIDGSVELYYDNAKKFETTGAGVTVFGSIQSQQLNVSGVITATNGFISSGSTSPVQISVSSGRLVFSVAGIGSTSFALG